MKYIISSIIVIALIGINYAFISPSNLEQKESITEKTISTPVKEGLNIGDKAPDIIMNGTNGKPIQLSHLGGKMVLIDFWASWCRPCRMENPNVVKAYKQFKDSKFKDGEGFTVYGVSLDQHMSKWESAIKADHLSWPYHVSDLKGWNNAAATKYGVRGIPANVLINGSGIIVAKNIRGAQLMDTLYKLKN